MRFLLRDLKYTGQNGSDVIITIGKEETFMNKKTLKFSQSDAFIGFHGKVSNDARQKYPITRLGVVNFMCREELITPIDLKDPTWREKVEDNYEEYDIFYWVGGGLLALIVLYCWIWCWCRRCK